MCWFVRIADELTMTMKCCGSIVRTIDIQTPSGALAMGYCERCDDRRWFHDQVEVGVRDVIAVAAKDWRNTRLWRNPAKLQAV
jgi:hypothetical protein